MPPAESGKEEKSQQAKSQQEGEGPLIQAVRGDDTERAKDSLDLLEMTVKILTAPEVASNLQSKMDVLMSALCAAVRYGHVSSLETLLELAEKRLGEDALRGIILDDALIAAVNAAAKDEHVEEFDVLNVLGERAARLEVWDEFYRKGSTYGTTR